MGVHVSARLRGGAFRSYADSLAWGGANIWRASGRLGARRRLPAKGTSSRRAARRPPTTRGSEPQSFRHAAKAHDCAGRASRQAHTRLEPPPSSSSGSPYHSSCCCTACGGPHGSRGQRAELCDRQRCRAQLLGRFRHSIGLFRIPARGLPLSARPGLALSAGPAPAARAPSLPYG